MRSAKLIIPDAGPLFSFAAIGELNLLFELGIPVFLTDYIEWKTTRSETSTANRIAHWIADNSERVTVIETEAGADRIRKEKANIHDKRKNVGQLSIFEVISNDYIAPGPYIFLFEDEKMQQKAGMTYFDHYPVRLTSIYGFLVALERRGKITNADQVFSQMRGV